MNRLVKKLVSVALAGAIALSSMSVMATNTPATVAETQVPVITEISYDIGFEANEEENLGGFIGAGSTPTSVLKLTNRMVHDGEWCLQIDPESHGRFGVEKDMSENQVGKNFSVWVYNDGDSKRYITFKLKNGNTDLLSFGIQAGLVKAYSNKSNSAVVLPQLNFSSDIAVDNAWNQFEIDMTNPGYLTVSVNGNIIGSQAITADTYASFDKIRLENSNTSETSRPAELAVYIDDISITSDAPVPSKLVIDEDRDTLDWTYAPTHQDPTDYEYSVDGGVTWTNVDAKPVVIGNIAIGENAVQVRVKAPEGAGYTYPVIKNETAIEYDANINLYMDREEDIEFFDVLVNTPVPGTRDPITIVPEMTISDNQSRSGITSMQIIPSQASDNSGAYPISPNLFKIGKTYDELVTDKVLTMWMYDDLNYADGYYKLIADVIDTTDPTTVKESFVGFNNAVNEDTYTVRSKSGTPDNDWNTWGDTGVERTQGWHCFQWDFTQDGICEIYIDGVKVREYAADGFNAFYVQDTWAHQNGVVDTVHFVDDITITDTRDAILMVPEAPTNPVVDDENNTFGWDYVTGKEDISLYEYSIDSGKTFTTCDANPQYVSDKLLNAGDVMVRLKATDTEVAGQVLRNNVNYTYPTDIIDLYEFASCFFEGDYTASSWTSFKTSYDKVTTAIETNNFEDGLFEEFEASVDALELDMETYKKYEFDDGSVSAENPMTLIAGEFNDHEYSNLSVPSGKGIHLDATEDENGDLVASVKYTVAEPLSDKVLGFYFRDVSEDVEITVDVYNSVTGNGFRFYNNSRGNYTYYPIVAGELGTAIPSGSKRNTDWHAMEYNFTNYGKGQVFIDERFIYESEDFTSFDTVEITRRNHKSSADITLTMDNLMICDANRVTSLALPEENVSLGYYDMYDININNYIIEVEDDSYPTTDRFTYSSSNYDVAHVTAKGTIENTSVGTAIATVVSSSGLSASVNVLCEDRKVESVQISDSPLIIDPNFVETLNMLPNTKAVVNAILAPEGVTVRDTVWESSDETIVKVQDGLLTAGTKEGSATITVTTADGSKQDSIVVTVAKDAHVYGETLYVSLDGNDATGDGSLENPYRSIEKAQLTIREMKANGGLPTGGVLVFIREGKYEVLEGFVFTAEDSGTEESPIKYMAYPGEEVNFVGSIDFLVSEMELVDDTDTLTKLPNEAEGKVYEIDMSDKINEFKPLIHTGHGVDIMKDWLAEDGRNLVDAYYSVTIDGVGQTLARWPNDGVNTYEDFYGMADITKIVTQSAKPRYWADDLIGRKEWISPENRDTRELFTIQASSLTTRMQSWELFPFDEKLTDDNVTLDPSNYPWLNGYFGANFSTQTMPVNTLYENGNLIGDEPATYGVSSDIWARFYIYNIIQELDIPGEWYFDQGTYKLYIYPPEGTDMQSDDSLVQFAVLEDNMFTFDEAQYITLDGINMSTMLGSAVVTNGAYKIDVRNCDITGTQQKAAIVDYLDSAFIGATSGGGASEETPMSRECGFSYVNVTDTNGGIQLNGGSDATLEKGLNYAVGCVFDNFATLNRSYNPAVGMTGTGNIASFCEIKNGPHAGILYYGNEHLMEFLDIYQVVQEASDQGAIFTGANIVDRDTIIRNSYIHDMPAAGGNASENRLIYLDGNVGGIYIMDNAFDNNNENTSAIFVNGGRDHTIIGNTFTEVKRAVSVSDGPYNEVQAWYKHGYGLFGNTFDNNELPYDLTDPNTPYAKYTHLVTTEFDDMLSTKYNRIIDNVTEGNVPAFETATRGVQPDADAQIKDDTFDKNNVENVTLNYYTLSATAGENGSVRVSSTKPVMETGIVSAFATPDAGFVFAGWESNGQIISTSSVYTEIMYSNVELKATFAPLVITDKTSLQTKITEVEAMDLSGYTAESVSALNASLTASRQLLNTESPSQTEIDNSLAELTNSVNALTTTTAPSEGKIVVEQEEASVGDTVMVDITVEDNTALAAMKLNIEYDETALKLVSVTFNKDLGSMVFAPASLESPLVLNWVNDTATDITTKDFTFATLEFEVLDTANKGVTDITVAYSPNDTINSNLEKVSFEEVNGSVEVVEYVYGDINDDGVVNNKDILRLLNYISDSSTAINMKVADVNDDGFVDNKDAMILFDYVSVA